MPRPISRFGSAFVNEEDRTNAAEQARQPNDIGIAQCLVTWE